MLSHIVETTRLLLRPPLLSDAEAVFQQYAEDRVVTLYLAWRPHRDLGETEAFLQSRIAAWEQGSRYSRVISHKDDRKVLGMISQRQVMPFRVSLAYVLGRPFWGQGHMTEAAQVIADQVLRQPEIFR